MCIRRKEESWAFRAGGKLFRIMGYLVEYVQSVKYFICVHPLSLAI